jgi:hypothetical protein
MERSREPPTTILCLLFSGAKTPPPSAAAVHVVRPSQRGKLRRQSWLNRKDISFNPLPCRNSIAPAEVKDARWTFGRRKHHREAWILASLHGIASPPTLKTTPLTR